MIIWSLGKSTGLKLGEVCSLFIFYKNKVSWLFPLDGSQFILLMCDNENNLYIKLHPYKLKSEFDTSWSRFRNNSKLEKISQWKTFHLSITYDSYWLKECHPKRRKISMEVSERFPLASLRPVWFEGKSDKPHGGTNCYWFNIPTISLHMASNAKKKYKSWLNIIRAVFIWVSKSNWFCVYYATRLVKKLAPFFIQSLRRKTKTNRDSLVRVFPLFASPTCNYFAFWLVYLIICALCDWLEWLPWFWFYDTQLKTALKNTWELEVIIIIMYCFWKLFPHFRVYDVVYKLKQ